MDDDEHYRERWLSCFLATYATVGVLSGIAVSVATSIKREDNAPLVGAVCILSAVQVVLILWMFQRLRGVYDRLGFTPTFRDERAGEEYNSRTKRYAETGKKIRRLSEKMVHAILLVQAVLLWCAWK